jgi:acyl-CoA thioesterase I
MRRIILTLAALTLTACSVEDSGRAARGSGGGGAAGGATAAGAGGAATAAEGTDAGQTGDDAAPGASAVPAAAGAPDGAAASAARSAASAAAAAAADHRIVLFVGTSLTAGYGVGEQVAYPAVIQQKIDSTGLPFRVVNAGISGETSAGGLRRINWSLQQPVDVLVLELGANDGLRGLDPGAMRANLDEIMSRTRSRYPDAAIVLVGMEAPPNLGDAYTSSFRRVFADLARKHDAVLLPFLLEGVAADPALNIEDGMHPNAAGHRVIAGTVWSLLEPVLRRRAAQPPGSD